MNIFKKNKIDNWFNLKIFYCFRIALIFQLYLDLSLYRGWKNIKILFDDKKKNYFLISSHPKKKKNNFEIFFPFTCDSKIDFHNIFKIFQITDTKNKALYFKKINVAFLDQQNTITYYRVTTTLHKSNGPIGRM
jgi:hypothetical protein